MTPGDLEPEVEDLLVLLADAARTVPRAQRRFFVMTGFSPSGASSVSGAPLREEIDVAPQDLNYLRERGYIVTDRYKTDGTFQFYVTPDGDRYVEAIREGHDSLRQQQVETAQYIEGAGFAQRYPEAARKWRQAARYLAADPIGHSTRIGHDCREALAEFAGALVDRHDARDLDEGRGTVDSIRSVIERHGSSAKVSAFLAALLAYWGTVSDLAQRQEHGASKEGEALTSEDARRLVWYSALVMYEIDRAFPT